MKQVLIVDDDPSVRRMLELTFASAGFTVATASNGVEAMKTVELRHFDLAVMDMVMPEKEGIEPIIELKEKRPDMRIIAVSGGARFGLTGEVKLEAQDALRLARRIGANYCFSKPHRQLRESKNRLLVG